MTNFLPFAVCDSCGKAVGLPVADAPDLFYCPACSARDALVQAARAQLQELAAPVLGTWAAAWSKAGLKLEDLADATDSVCESWMAQRGQRRTYLRALRMAYPLPPRAKLEAQPAPVPHTPAPAPVPVLPVLIACREEAGRAVLLVDRAGQVFQHAVPLACPHGLITGQRGQVLTLYPDDLTRAVSFEIWPDILLQVTALFSSPVEVSEK